MIMILIYVVMEVAIAPRHHHQRQFVTHYLYVTISLLEMEAMISLSLVDRWFVVHSY